MEMETLNKLIDVLFNLVLIPIIPLLTVYITMLIKKQISKIEVGIESDIAKKYLDMAEDTLIKSVLTVSEVYVKSLKAQGKFGIEEQKIAMNMAKDMFMSVITDDCKNAVIEANKDYEKWIEASIEAIINQSK